MSSEPNLQELADALLLGVERLKPLPGLLTTSDGADLRELLLLYLKTKVIPELKTAGDLPIFVGVQGGANVGKSTIFNALAGKILSPSILLASATKHPLVFLHEKWRDTFFPESPFKAMDCQELADPKDLTIQPERTDLLYFKFHQDSDLEPYALIDSPDFDSALLTNLEVARKITALSDVTFFVTTSQKYKDRELIFRLRQLMELKSRVILVFNRVNEEIVFNTLVDDLEEVISLKEADVSTLRLPESSAAHPEEDLREALKEPFQREVGELTSNEIKPIIVKKTLHRVIDRVGELQSRYLPEQEFKDKLKGEIQTSFNEELIHYRDKFDLAFPEETLAIQKILGMTELSPHLRLPASVEGGSNVFKLVAIGLRKSAETARDFLVRLTPSREGSIEDRPQALVEYQQGRDDNDTDRVLRGGERLRMKVESFCRDHESQSALSKQLLNHFFTTEKVSEFPEQIKEHHQKLLEEQPGREQDLVDKVERWQDQRKGLGNLIFLFSMVLKVFAGFTLAWVLPPDGLFNVINWAFFAFGYFIAAYLIALGVSYGVRRKIAFKKRRVECFKATIQDKWIQPLEASTLELLSQEEIASIVRVSEQIEKHPDMQATEAKSDS